MNILYFSWGELTKTDCIKHLSQVSNVTVLEVSKAQVTQHEEIAKQLQIQYDQHAFHLIFSFNFLPTLAKFSYFHKIPYVSYVYDSPLQSLNNEWIYSPYNYFFLFDSIQAKGLQQKGISHAFYLPLPIAKERMLHLNDTPIAYKDDISFMGCLYADSNDFFSHIKGIKPDTKKRIDDCLVEQQKEQGTARIDEALDSDTIKEISDLISMKLSDEYHLTNEQLIRNSLCRTCTAKERTNLIHKIAEHFPLSLYTYSDTSALQDHPNVILYGPLDYMTTMPQTFRNSKINLNFTLRGIKSGIPLRCIDVLGAGGFLITNYQKDLEKHFQNKKDLVWYHTPEELLSLIGYYLEHEEERKQIALNGQQKILSLFSYEKQLTTIFDIVSKHPVVEHCNEKIPVSVCLIGKNEEKHVENCLKPWFDLGFEILVADTGSTDRTMELCRQYTNNVFYHPWTNHFGDAKNAVIKWARNPYVLFIDFDEYRKNIDLNNFINQCNPFTIGMLTRTTPNSNGIKGQPMLEQVPRLFHKDFFQFEGRVQEQVCSLKDSPPNYVSLPLTVEHKGYTNIEDIKEKSLCNLKLLLLDLEEQGENPYIYFHIGRCYQNLNDFDHALEYFQLALSMEVDPDFEYVQSLVEAYGFCLLEKKDLETALQLENIYEDFSKRADFVFLMGLIYMNTGRFEEAIVQFEKATTIENYSILGTNSYLSWYNAGVICEVCGLTEHAMDYYEKCEDYPPAQTRKKEISAT